MKTNRRQFIQSATLAGGASLAFPFVSCSSKSGTHSVSNRYSALDAVLKQPVLKRELFPDPVQDTQSGIPLINQLNHS